MYGGNGGGKVFGEEEQKKTKRQCQHFNALNKLHLRGIHEKHYCHSKHFLSPCCEFINSLLKAVMVYLKSLSFFSGPNILRVIFWNKQQRNRTLVHTYMKLCRQCDTNQIPTWIKLLGLSPYEGMSLSSLQRATQYFEYHERWFLYLQYLPIHRKFLAESASWHSYLFQFMWAINETYMTSWSISVIEKGHLHLWKIDCKWQTSYLLNKLSYHLIVMAVKLIIEMREHFNFLKYYILVAIDLKVVVFLPRIPLSMRKDYGFLY